MLSTEFSGDALEELVSVGCCGFFFGLLRGACWGRAEDASCCFEAVS